METKNTIELTAESIYPDDSVLESVLGESFEAYRALVELYDKNQMSHIWRYYKDGKAWLCKVQKKKRTIVWMSAWNGFIKATIYFPEKNLDLILSLDIDEHTKDTIQGTKNTGKSKPCIFEIRESKALKDFEKVMHFKIQTK
jgi:hypothetical protein